jgi:SAM-dependent methyltransferase
MPQHTKPEPYLWLAQYYDEVFAPHRSPFQKARNKFLQRILPRVKSACDLACGTGVTALIYARHGIETFAVDLSPAMCRLTSEKALRESLPVQVIQEDMRSFRLPHTVDLITCESDALNHIPRRSDLRIVTRAVGRALNAGGYFLFDVNNAKGFRRYWTGNVCIEKPGVMLVMRNGHSRDARRAWSDVEWFIRENGKDAGQSELWRRHHERVEEVCWTREEIWENLSEAGFDRLRSWDAKPFYRNNPYLTRGCHAIYLARKSR